MGCQFKALHVHVFTYKYICKDQLVLFKHAYVQYFHCRTQHTILHRQTSVGRKKLGDEGCCINQFY